jgi:hypothetical protein
MQKTTIHDINIAGFLSHLGFHPSFNHSGDGRISFSFVDNPEFQKALKSYYSEVALLPSELFESCKRIRSAVYQLKKTPGGAL